MYYRSLCLSCAAVIALTPSLVAAKITGSFSLPLVPAGTPSPGLPVGTVITNYPFCAQSCNNQSTYGICVDPTDISCVCGAAFRGNATGCEALRCTDAEVQETFELGQALCADLYRSDAAYSASVNFAVSSATSAALAALATRDPGKLDDQPKCSANCFRSVFASGICGEYSNRECVCHNPALNFALYPCQRGNCSSADFQTLKFIAETYCDAVGGIYADPKYGNVTNGTAGPSVTAAPYPRPPNTTSASVPSDYSPAAFTGGAPKLLTAGPQIVTLGIVGGIGALVVVL